MENKKNERNEGGSRAKEIKGKSKGKKRERQN